jgi:hypothetical protein
LSGTHLRVVGDAPFSVRGDIAPLTLDDSFALVSELRFGTLMKTLLRMRNRDVVQNLNALLLAIISLWPMTPGSYAAVGLALPPPSISSFSPSSGPVGTSVILNGENLSGTISVKFNGVPATFTFFGSQITTSVPQGATTGLITVSTLDGTVTSANDFVVFPFTGPPFITSFSPASGPAGTSVIINGKFLGDATDVKFNGVTATFTTDFFRTNLIAIVPSSAGTGPITVQTPTGIASSADTFTSTGTPPPLISDFTPSTGPVGARIIINGTNLTGTTAVKFNGQNAEFTIGFFGATIAAFVPAGATTGLITLENPAGPAVSATVFTVTAAPSPTITSFSPNFGLEGQRIIITGTHLEGATSVLFNGSLVPFNVFGSSTIFVTLPAGVSTGPITVVTPGGSFTTSNSFFVGSFVPGDTPVTLAIHSRADGSVEISWPADASGFFLETTESLVPVVAWSPVTSIPVIVADKKIVISDTISSSQFFRLRMP